MIDRIEARNRDLFGKMRVFVTGTRDWSLESRVTVELRMMDNAAAPTPPSPEAEAFYADALRELAKFGVPYLLAGTYAVSAYTGITRPTKDLDIFCKPAATFPILKL